MTPQHTDRFVAETPAEQGILDKVAFELFCAFVIDGKPGESARSALDAYVIGEYLIRERRRRYPSTGGNR